MPNIDREKAVGARLRAFREALQIPRSRFAVTVGCGSERLASYESGRAPLRYEVFRAISQSYQLSPLWLAKERGAPRQLKAFDDSKIKDSIRPRELFSEVYDRLIAKEIETRADMADEIVSEAKSALEQMNAILDDDSIPEKLRRKLHEKSRGLVEKIHRQIRRTEHLYMPGIEQQLETNNSGVDEVTAKGKYPGVKLTMASLLARLNKATESHGMKSKLAKYMDVPLPNVSQWLSGEREPSGETTLRLLHWVEQQERKK